MDQQAWANEATTEVSGDSADSMSGITKMPEITLTANETNYSNGDLYQLKMQFSNRPNEVVKAGTKIVLSIPDQAVDYSTWDFSDQAIQKFFSTNIDYRASRVVLTANQDIYGKVAGVFLLSAKIKGTPGESYPISGTIQTTTGTVDTLFMNTPKININQVVTPPEYGLLNLFWGYNGVNPGTYIGKNPIAVDGLPTGNFSNKQTEISNFVGINTMNTYNLGEEDHYVVAFSVMPSNRVGKLAFNKNKLTVYDETAGRYLNPHFYQVQQELETQMTIKLASPKESHGVIKANHKYVITFVFGVENQHLTYKTEARLKVLNQNNQPVETEKIFQLNNQFIDSGVSASVPTITATDKTFVAGELTQQNIKEKLLADVTATDFFDGDLTSQIKVDYRDLLTKAHQPGIYQEQVTYKVTNAAGRQATKTVSVTILAKEGKPVTVNYVDDKGNALLPTQELIGKVGEAYQTTAPTIPEWQLTKESAQVKGHFTEAPQTITFHYERVQGANVTVHFVDDAGQTLAKPVILTGKLGASYQSTPQEIAGWKVSEGPQNGQGIFTDKPQEVTYHYQAVTPQEQLPSVAPKPESLSKKQQKLIDLTEAIKVPLGAKNAKNTAGQVVVNQAIGTVVVHYVDENGNEIAPDTILNGKIGTPYNTDDKEVAVNEVLTSPITETTNYEEKSQLSVYIQEKGTIPFVPNNKNNQNKAISID